MSVTDISKLVNTSHPALPQIYAYTTPEIARHNGWTKIGYTEQNVDTSLNGMDLLLMRIQGRLFTILTFTVIFASLILLANLELSGLK